MIMSFNVLCMVHSPDADPQQHRSLIDTGQYKLFTVVVKDQTQALEVAQVMNAEQPLDSIMLCPGFTHLDVAQLYEALNAKVGICVARGDPPSNKISLRARQRAYGNK
jgi:hypothetical protein